MKVSAVIVTRGDVDLEPVLASLPDEWEKIEWNNGERAVYGHPPPSWYRNADDLGVYGRYAAIEHTDAELIYVQDDDCVVSDPAALVETWKHVRAGITEEYADVADDFVVCNMPQRFREQPQYASGEHCLVGFGAVFHRDAPERAFDRFLGAVAGTPEFAGGAKWFERTCDVVFTALTPRVLVDVPYEDLPWADGPDRMWRQPEHVAERQRMLELVRKVRDAEVARV